MIGIISAIFFILFTSLSFYYRFEWYSIAEYIHFLSSFFGLSLFIFTAVAIKEASKNIIYFFATLSGFGIVLMIAYFSLVKVEIYNIKTNEIHFYFKKNNLRGAYIYNPDKICYQFSYNFWSHRLIFTPINKKLYRVSFKTDLTFKNYFGDIDKKVDVYIKRCN